MSDGNRYSQSGTQWTEQDFARFTSSSERPARNSPSRQSSNKKKKSSAQQSTKPKKKTNPKKQRLPQPSGQSLEVQRRSRSVDSRGVNSQARALQQRPPNQRPPRSNERAMVQKKPKRKLGKNARIGITIFGIFLLIMLTAFLCIFLVFKLDTVVITGDRVYDDNQIISVCGYSKGDNLFFLSTTDKEELLTEKLPYIKSAKINRKMPHTMEIEIEAVTLVGSVQSGDSYLYMDGDSKVIEVASEPKNGIMTVMGLEVVNPAAGKPLEVSNEDAEAAYSAIAKTIDEYNAESNFTKLDLTNIHDIKLYYQDRVTFKLGNANDLESKIEFGISVMERRAEMLDPSVRGTLDLSMFKEYNKAPFDQDYTQLPVDTGDNSGDGDGDGAGSGPPAFASNEGRGDDIPDLPYGYEGASPDSSDDSGSDGGADNDDGSDGGSDDDYDDSGGSDYDSGSADDDTGYYDDDGVWHEYD